MRMGYAQRRGSRRGGRGGLEAAEGVEERVAAVALLGRGEEEGRWGRNRGG